jgi:hypothetical protein
MRLTADNGDFVELARADSGDDAHDLLLLVEVRNHGFSATMDTWVETRAWLGFTQDLGILEERRQGQARLESLSPGELSLTVRSIDHAGHMGVEGAVATRGSSTTRRSSSAS